MSDFSFNTQPPEGGCQSKNSFTLAVFVSTHSRPKAAAYAIICCLHKLTSFNTQPPEGGCTVGSHITHEAGVSTHSRPKAAGYQIGLQCFSTLVSTHSRPKAADTEPLASVAEMLVSTHSRPKAAGGRMMTAGWPKWFQHTAARRRLTFSRRKSTALYRFNTQPPEGGWTTRHCPATRRCRFNTQPPEGGCPFSLLLILQA